jgi:hypothetical protein
MPIRDLLLANKAQIFFHGHDHLFVKQDYYASGITNGSPDLIYQEVPQPSHYPYDATSYATGTNIDYNYQSGVFYGSAGHLRVTVSPTNATVDYVRSYRPSDAGKTNRTVTYSYSLPPSTMTNPPAVLAAFAVSNNTPGFSISGAIGQNHAVQASTNLANWSDLFITNLSATPVYWSDPQATNFPQRFYRVRIAP